MRAHQRGAMLSAGAAQHMVTRGRRRARWLCRPTRVSQGIEEATHGVCPDMVRGDPQREVIPHLSYTRCNAPSIHNGREIRQSLGWLAYWHQGDRLAFFAPPHICRHGLLTRDAMLDTPT